MEHRKCKGCGAVKEVAEYYDYNKVKYGKCKECVRNGVKRNPAEYDKTEKGVIRVIYKTQKRNRKVRGLPPPDYTKTELRQWLYENNFKALYDKWVTSGYTKDCKPSVDRVDTFKGYTLDNIRLVTWYDNRTFQKEDILNAKGTSGARCKSIRCYDRNNNFVAEYISLSAAKRAIGYSPFNSVKSGNKDKRGYYWQYITPAPQGHLTE
jgi:hypothetical protein